MALRGVQLPVPVLQWSDWTERTYIKKKLLKIFPGLFAAFPVVRPFLLGPGWGSITTPGPAMVRLDRKDINKKKLLKIYPGLLTAFPGGTTNSI